MAGGGAGSSGCLPPSHPGPAGGTAPARRGAEGRGSASTRGPGSRSPSEEKGFVRHSYLCKYLASGAEGRGPPRRDFLGGVSFPFARGFPGLQGGAAGTGLATAASYRQPLGLEDRLGSGDTDTRDAWCWGGFCCRLSGSPGAWDVRCCWGRAVVGAGGGGGWNACLRWRTWWEGSPSLSGAGEGHASRAEVLGEPPASSPTARAARQPRRPAAVPCACTFVPGVPGMGSACGCGSHPPPPSLAAPNCAGIFVGGLGDRLHSPERSLKFLRWRKMCRPAAAPWPRGRHPGWNPVWVPQGEPLGRRQATPAPPLPSDGLWFPRFIHCCLASELRGLLGRKWEELICLTIWGAASVGGLCQGGVLLVGDVAGAGGSAVADLCQAALGTCSVLTPRPPSWGPPWPPSHARVVAERWCLLVCVGVCVSVRRCSLGLAP